MTGRDDEPVLVPIEDAIDLHTFSPREATSVVEEYLCAAREAGLTEVRVIHGRGLGVQRAAIHDLLRRLPFVVRASDAPPGRGGWGATVIELAPAETTKDPTV